MYSASASRATLTTVRSVAGDPSRGSRWRKSSIESAPAQNASAAPSRGRTPSTRAARIVAGPVRRLGSCCAHARRPSRQTPASATPRRDRRKGEALSRGEDGHGVLGRGSVEALQAAPYPDPEGAALVYHARNLAARR